MIYAILIIAVFIGIFLAHFLKKSARISELLLMFSGSYLLCVTLLHNFPLLYQKGEDQVWLFIILGIIIQMILESFSKGVEHGHIHHNEKLSLSIVFGLMAHAFLEGMPLKETHIHDNLLLAIAIHKIPVATILYINLSSIFKHQYKVYIAMSIFALLTPLGSFSSNYTPLINYPYYILALVSGVFIHISTTILFENSDKSHQISWQKLIMLLLSTILVLAI